MGLRAQFALGVDFGDAFLSYRILLSGEVSSILGSIFP